MAKEKKLRRERKHPETEKPISCPFHQEKNRCNDHCGFFHGALDQCSLVTIAEGLRVHSSPSREYDPKDMYGRKTDPNVRVI